MRGQQLVAISALLTLYNAVIGAQAGVGIPEDDRYLKLNQQLVTLPPGQGGQLRVTAPREWCADGSRILEVRQYPRSGSLLTFIRLKTGSSACDWTFDGVPPGEYDAVILSARDREIAGIGYARVSRAATSLLAVGALDTEVEGRITAAGPLPTPLRLVVSVAGPRGEINRWHTSVGADGSYRIALGDVDADTLVFFRAEAASADSNLTTPAINSVFLKMARVSKGLQRLDIENVKIPPCVIHIDVPPSEQAGFGAFGLLQVDGSFGEGFKLLRGFHGQALVNYGPHTLTILTNDRKQELASAKVTVTLEKPRELVTIAVRVPSETKNPPGGV
jgi:hypothetical protein